MRLNQAMDQIDKSIKQTGNELGDFRQKISTIKVSPEKLDPVLSKFDQEISKFGLQYVDGNIVEMPRRKTKLSQNEINQLGEMRNDILDIKADPTAQLIIDTRSKFDSNINYLKDRKDISSNLDGISRDMRAELAKINRGIIGREQSSILERYSDLNDLVADYRKSSAKGNNPEFFLKRIMTERGRVPRGVADRIFQETGIDLSADAAIINSITRDLAPPRMKSALSQEVEQANVRADMAVGALISPEIVAAKLAAKGMKLFFNKYFSGDKNLLKAIDKLTENDEALLELKKALSGQETDFKGWSNIDEATKGVSKPDADFKKAGSAESALLEEAKKYKTADEFVQKVKGSATQYGEYNPGVRAEIPAGYKNIAELGIDPEETITVYRGIDDSSGKVKRKINDGDFVTTDFDSALSYTGDPKDVVEMKVKAKTLYNSEPRDFADEPFYTGSEYIYTTKQSKQLPADTELKQIWEEANQPLK